MISLDTIFVAMLLGVFLYPLLPVFMSLLGFKSDDSFLSSSLPIFLSQFFVLFHERTRVTAWNTFSIIDAVVKIQCPLTLLYGLEILFVIQVSK